MSGKSLSTFFEDYIKKEPIFINKKALQSVYVPKKIPHRQKEIDHLANILAPILRQEKPSNIFIYGNTGTGKTITIKYVTDEIFSITEKNKLPVKIIYLNCKLKRVADTEYRLIAELIKQLGEKVADTGLATDQVYRKFIETIENKKIKLLIILDEIDQLVVKKIGGESLLYNLTRLNMDLKHSEISIIGISNLLHFLQDIDPRVKSSLSEEEILFPPYNAPQIQTILNERSKEAFREGVIKEGVIEKCAALAAKEHGDARKALDLLRVAGELAERKGKTSIMIEDLDEADETLERDTFVEYVSSQPKHSKITLYAIINRLKQDSQPRSPPPETGEIVEIYKEMCSKCKITPLTPRRVSALIAQLDQAGVIRANLISKGRNGRTRQIHLNIGPSTLPKIENILKEGLGL